ncbi:hypothetical protein HQ531_02815 [bacterium]|nr:hypothetical protein [bacterium]
MPGTLINFIIRLLLSTFVVPLLIQAQVVEPDIKTLNRKIDQLSKMLNQLRAGRSQSQNIHIQMEDPCQDYTKRDSLRLIALRRKQAESRARIDEITMEIIKLSKQLEDPRKRYALAQKIQEQGTNSKSILKSGTPDSTSSPETISARSIDLAAVKLVRQGKSLDQARLLTIDKLSTEQVLAFYRGLPKSARYELYDIADEIAESEGITLEKARRSAIYFYLFTK